MSRSLDYLKTMQVLYINLDRCADRRASFETHITPLFRKSTRIIADDGAIHVSDEQAKKFRDAWEQTVLSRGHEMSSINRAPGERYLVDRMKYTLAIYRSHLRALEYGYTQGWDRFFIAEDDIVPKSAMLEGEVPMPPHSQDMNIWSGGLPMAALKTDDEAYARGDQMQWKTLPDDKNAHNVLGAGLYEVTHDSAALLHYEVAQNPMPYDHAWGFAIKKLQGSRLYPTGFGQMGLSIRNGKTRDQVLTRSN